MKDEILELIHGFASWMLYAHFHVDAQGAICKKGQAF